MKHSSPSLLHRSHDDNEMTSVCHHTSSLLVHLTFMAGNFRPHTNTHTHTHTHTVLRPYSALTQCTFFQYTRTDKYYRSAGDIAASSIRTRRPVQTNLVTSAAHTTETRWHICILHVVPFTAACDSRARPVTGNIWWRNCISMSCRSQQLVSIAMTIYVL